MSGDRNGKSHSPACHVTCHVSRVTFLLVGAVVFRIGADVQTDAGDGSVRPVVAGLLAAEPVWGGGEPLFDFVEVDRRKDSTHCIIDGSVLGDTFDSAPGHRDFLFRANQ